MTSKTIANGSYYAGYAAAADFITNYGTIGGGGLTFLQTTPVTLVNAGTVAGVDLALGTITNTAAGRITGATLGVLTGGVDPAVCTVVNQGYIGGSLSGAVMNIGTLSNEVGGTIVGGYYGVRLRTAGFGPSTLFNAGHVSGTSMGVRIENKLAVMVNRASGSITGAVGVSSPGRSGITITNAGTITGTGGTAVALFGAATVNVLPGAVFNGVVDGGGTGDSSLVLGGHRLGKIAGIGSSFVNFGTVSVSRRAHWRINGAVTGSPTLTDRGTLDIAGTIGAGPSGFSVTVSGGGSLSVLGGASVYAVGGMAGSATITNAGSIGGGGQGIRLFGGGLVENSTGGTISGSSAAVIFNSGNIFDPGFNGHATLHNAGAITSDYLAVRLHMTGGTSVIDNQAGGTIAGNVGIGAFQTGTGKVVVTNENVISGTGVNSAGIRLNTNYKLALNNAAGAVVSGETGVVAPTGTVFNAGTIVGSGGIAVDLSAGSGSRVIATGGAVFDGDVKGGAGSVLELSDVGGAGTIATLGSQFSGFAKVVVDGGAAWTLAGSAGAMVNGGTVTVSGELDVAGRLSGAGRVVLEGNALLSVGGLFSQAGVTFLAGGDGTLEIGKPLGFSGAILGFDAGDTIDLVGFGGVNGLAYDPASSQLSVLQAGGGSLSLTMVGGFTGADFGFASDGHGGTLLTHT